MTNPMTDQETAREIVDRYNAGFIDQANNTNRPALVKWIAHALAVEREAAALVCDKRAAQAYDTYREGGRKYYEGAADEASECADAIRTRGR